MGGFFGITSKKDCVQDVYFGVDYHSHLGKYRAGMATVDENGEFEREIHNIENSPFRTKFDNIAARLKGKGCIGCISDADTQPLLIRSKFGVYAISMVGVINNHEEIVTDYLNNQSGIFQCMSKNRINSTEIIAALIEEKDTFVEGIEYACKLIDGSVSLLILKENGNLVVCRDRFGRIPVAIGQNEDGFCASFESFAYEKLDFHYYKELKAGEIAEISPNEYTVLKEGTDEMKICAFLWTYYGYPNACYEGINVEAMRMRNGEILAQQERENGTLPKVDYVSGVPDSGTPHAIGYANESGNKFARPFIKYTPAWARSFIPSNQEEKNKIAKMKQVPVNELIKDKDLLFVDDSIVRGTQLRETVDFLYNSGAKSVHMRSACPPIMYGCKYLNFSRNTSDMELITRSVIVELEGEEGLKYIDEYADGSTQRGKKLRKTICEKLHFDSLEYQSLDGMIKAIGIEPCKVCTYCWNGKE
ncbi:MAG: amidophosphoribosyltransferase [Clostridia bacterium]|nr:amidophosphoribosyltransferase [Clostridia bacterium]